MQIEYIVEQTDSREVELTVIVKSIKHPSEEKFSFVRERNFTLLGMACAFLLH